MRFQSACFLRSMIGKGVDANGVEKISIRMLLAKHDAGISVDSSGMDISIRMLLAKHDPSNDAPCATGFLFQSACFLRSMIYLETVGIDVDADFNPHASCEA